MAGGNEDRFTIIGAGLGGALAAIALGRAGYEVEVYEMRGDLRSADVPPGRSINLALSHRGICALRHVGLAEQVLATAVPMHGRLIHSLSGKTTLQPYGKDETQVINSVPRGGLNCILLDAAEACPNVSLFFNHKCTGLDLTGVSVKLNDMSSKRRLSVSSAAVIGADGAFSAVRRSMQRLDRFDYAQDYLEHGYMELTIPPAPGGGFQMYKNALHIWPRKSFMMIALPNRDSSFTCTLFWPFDGLYGFSERKKNADVVTYFQKYFRDAVPLMPCLAEEFMRNPVSSLATIRCGPWFVEDRVVLLGDAAHAVVPFYGQGMNASFEDVLALLECLEKHGHDRRLAFSAYYEARKPNVDALADLAIANFIEMRDHTGSRLFLFKKGIERWLSRLFPRWFVPLYTLVTFTRVPYVQAVRRARVQNRTAAAIAVVLIIAVAGVTWLLVTR